MTVKPREIWEKGTPLNKAFIVFSDSKLRKIFNDSAGLKNAPQIDFEKGFAENVITALGVAAKAINAPKLAASAKTEMQRNLIQALSKGKLIAYAFPTWPSEARIPRLIQSHFWVNAHIDWDNETAQDESNRFQKIRIINPKEFPSINFRPKIGRKSHADKITWAISEAEKQSQSFWDLTNKEKIAEVRKLIKSKWPEIKPDGPALGDDAIRKQINRYKVENKK